MLNNDDRNAIEGLFSRLADVERRAEQRDADAERLIDEKVVRQPSAPYYMAQTILVQEHALEVAERRIRELEDEARQQDRGSDFFGGMFGGGRDDRRRDEDDNRGPWNRRQDSRYDRDRYDDERRSGFGGGGFLAGAAQTALGVTSGILIGNVIASMFGGGTAHAAEAPQQEQDQGNDANNDADSGHDGFDDGGGFDGGGGFDTGGDF